MYYCSNYLLAVLFCVVTMFCWGSWGNTQKLAGKTWRYELFYWDYVIGVVLFALVSGLTAGSFGGGEWGFVANLKQASAANLGSAFLGGIVFNAANILLAAAISIAGMSVAFPVGIGLALVLGVVVNYVGAPKGDPVMLFGGVALIVAAILCNAFAYRLKALAGNGRAVCPQTAENGALGTTRPTMNGGVGKGIALSVVCGVLMAFFYRFIARTMDMDFAAAAPQPGMMTPYSAFFVFALGIFASNFVFNAIAMRHPVSGEPITEREYFRGGFAIHLVGILGGLIWGLGNGINLVAAGKAGAAISYGLGQGATLVSALWGILVWREFKGAPKNAVALNLAMFVLFIAGLGAIIAAGESKEDAPKEPVKVIFDTDMIEDFDDVGALACLHALADAGECEILATVSSTHGNASVGVIEVINRYYGRADLPVGAPKGMGIMGAFAGAKEKVDPAAPLGERKGGDGGHYKYRKLLADYQGWYRYADSDDAPDANDVYRRVLAAQPDNSVVICTVGFLTNMRRLLETKPDAVSPLNGRELVAKKVKKWVAMACRYPDGKEYNSQWDPESSRIALDLWPTTVVFSDWSYGFDIFAGRAIAEAPAAGRNPVRDVFAGNIPSRDEVAADPAKWLRRCFGMGGRSSWDETAVLAAVRGEDSYFNVNRGRYRMVGRDGADEWAPDENGPHVRITEKMPKAEVGRIIDELIMRRPKILH